MKGTAHPVTFILGGARSGKSSRAQALAEAAGRKALLYGNRTGL